MNVLDQALRPGVANNDIARIWNTGRSVRLPGGVLKIRITPEWWGVYEREYRAAVESRTITYVE